MKLNLLTTMASLLLILSALYAWFIHAPTPAEPGYELERVALDVSGRQRNLWIFDPRIDREQAPLLLVFHGSGGNVATIRRRTGYRFEAIGEREGFVVAYPNGVEGNWNGCRRAATHMASSQNVNDVGFVQKIVEDLSATRQIDADRVYAIGYSNGGHMAFRLALESPHLVAGVAAFAANLPSDENMSCDGSATPVRAVIVNGTKDRINPYGGGEVSLFGVRTFGNVRSSLESANYFRSMFKAGSSHRMMLGYGNQVHAEISEFRWIIPLVALVTIHNGGHTIPQTAYRYPRLLGTTFRNDQVIEYVYQFLTEGNPRQGSKPSAKRSLGKKGLTQKFTRR